MIKVNWGGRHRNSVCLWLFYGVFNHKNKNKNGAFRKEHETGRKRVIIPPQRKLKRLM